MDIKSSPRITVLMSVYNGQVYLAEAVESILTQTFSDFDFLIIDDCSTDQSVEILEDYAKSDARVKLIKNENNLGLTVSLNKGIRMAKGEFIARMDADDIAYPTRFEQQVKLFENNTDVGVCGTNVRYFDETGDIRKSDFPLEHRAILPTQFVYSAFVHPSVMFRREIIEPNNLYYNEQFRYAQDYDLWYRMLKITQGANLEECLLRFRIDDSQISSVHETEQNQFASKVRMQVVLDIGIELNDETSLFHSRLLTEAWELSQDNLRKINDWFQHIIDLNIKTEMFSAPHFSAFIAEFYYKQAKCHLQMPSYLFYKKSSLSQYHKRGVWPVLWYQAKSRVKTLIGR